MNIDWVAVGPRPYLLGNAALLLIVNYFFTAVIFQRREILCLPENVALLWDAFKTVKQNHPFQIDAFVLLPDHLHCIWSLPTGDCDYPLRWLLSKPISHAAVTLATKSGLLLPAGANGNKPSGNGAIGSTKSGMRKHGYVTRAVE